MFTAKVIGTVVCTRNVPGMDGVKLLMIQPLNDDMTNRGPPTIAVDIIRTSGMGEYVYVIEKKEATFPFDPVIPVDLGVAGSIDEHFVDLNMLSKETITNSNHV